MEDCIKNGSWILLKVILISLFLLGCKLKPEEELAVNYLVRNSLTTNQDSQVIHKLIDTLLEATPWKDKILINRQYNHEYVNIYIINGNESKVQADYLASTLRSNCSFLGHNIILLDDSYLRSFLTKHKVPKDIPSEFLLREQECFLYWVIGHEAGHLVCGHNIGHFDTGSLDSFVKSSSLENREELQADSFFVQSVVSRTIIRNSIERLMIDILNAEIESKVGKIKTMGVGIIYDYNDNQVVTYARQSTHPEYVVRLARMLELSSRMSKDSGLNNLVGGFIRNLKER